MAEYYKNDLKLHVNPVQLTHISDNYLNDICYVELYSLFCRITSLSEPSQSDASLSGSTWTTDKERRLNSPEQSTKEAFK